MIRFDLDGSITKRFTPETRSEMVGFFYFKCKGFLHIIQKHFVTGGLNMILTDRIITRMMENAVNSNSPLIHPFRWQNVQPASYDLTLGNQFREQIKSHLTINLTLSAKQREQQYSEYSERPYSQEVNLKDDGLYALPPGQFVLACTKEWIILPDNLQAQVCGKSSLGRLGLFVENAGFIDPGFSGILTLELYNCSRNTLLVGPGMTIAQISFQETAGPVDIPYGDPRRNSHYQHQTGATASRYDG